MFVLTVFFMSIMFGKVARKVNNKGPSEINNAGKGKADCRFQVGLESVHYMDRMYNGSTEALAWRGAEGRVFFSSNFFLFLNRQDVVVKNHFYSRNQRSIRLGSIDSVLQLIGAGYVAKL